MELKIISINDEALDVQICRLLYNLIARTSNLENKYLYIRGVAPSEALFAVNKQNGQVDKSKAVTNRGDDETRLSFGLNEIGQKGVSMQVLEDVILEIAYYANMGAHVEATGSKDVSSEFQGYFLVFATDEPLDRHGINPAMYGKNWRTTAELPEGIEDSLAFIIKAPISAGLSSFQAFDINQRVSITGNVDQDSLAFVGISLNK
ncbi:MAG: hypothetical protein PHF25_01645 [Candidatus Margulisbacteria bacterium]|nr:hypothetical protein [Candidatus Margulisiibacteriota bacterium]